jgi:hypothetical protein
MSRTKLRAVPKPVEAPLILAGDIYADVRAAAKDRERWAKVHVAGDRREPLDIFTPPHKRTWASWGLGWTT